MIIKTWIKVKSVGSFVKTNLIYKKTLVLLLGIIPIFYKSAILNREVRL